MASDSLFNHNCIILDACCIINLYATERMSDILQSIPKSILVAAYVREFETLYIRGADVHNQKEQIDLQPLIDMGLLTVVTPDTEAELTTFINFAAVLYDDGESVTGAIAVHRNWAIGTDDRGAIRFFQREVPNIQLLSSLAMIKHWAETVNLEIEELQNVLRRMRQRARYFPHVGHTLYNWWQELYGT